LNVTNKRALFPATLSNIISSLVDKEQKALSLRYLYTFLFYCALPGVFMRLLWRSRRSADYRKRWAERLGYCPYRRDKCIWVHAASVGETLGAIPLIKALQAQYPELPIVVTNMTITGSTRTRATFGASVLNVYVPYDLPAAIARFLQRVNPVVAIMMETELWPNTLFACQQRHIPIVVANARLSAKSAAGYQRVASLTRQMFSTIHTLAVQTQVEAERFIALGLPAERVMVTGSIKFDVEVSPELLVKGAELRAQLGQDRLVWIAASTHQGEEEIVLAAHKRIIETLPQALLILVPRHPERFDAIFHLVQQQGFKTIRRSQHTSCAADMQVYLGDTMGELLLLYSASDVAFVAGSFVPVGGHNMLEAAVLGKPIVVGPQLFNFAEISEKLIAANGMKKVLDVDALATEVIHLLQDSAYRQKIGANAQGFVDANRGAVAKHLALIKAVVANNLIRI
jgi:3-deoxy-D-manno-octulosonic-acid transferase